MTSIRLKRRRENIVITLLAVLLGVVLIFPLLYAFFGSFKSTAEFATGSSGLLPQSFLNFDNFAAVFRKIPLGRYFFNSLAVALLGTLVRMACAVLAAYAFTFFEFRGKKPLFFLLLGSMMIPGDTLLITNYLTVSSMGLLNTYIGMCITSFVGASQMFMLRQKFRTLKKDYRDAAEIDGCGDFAFIWFILLPMARPILLTLVVQSFVTLWNAYLWPLLVTSEDSMRTIQVGITMLTSVEDSNYPLVLAGVVLAIIPSFLLFLFLRKNIVKGITTGALVG